MNDNEVGEKSKDVIKIDESDITFEKVKLFMNNIHMFEIIRKKIINKNYKLFNENLKDLVEFNNTKAIPEKCKDNNNWNCAINDKLLFYFTNEYGLPYLNSKINEINIFQNCKFNYKDYVSRLNFLCDYFEEKIKHNKLNEKLNNIIQEQKKVIVKIATQII